MTTHERDKLAMALEQADESVVITDTDGTIQYVNPAFERITGYKPEDAIGNTPRILKSGQHAEVFYKQLWKSLETGQSWSSRFINRKKDGTIFEVEQAISPVRDSEGRIVNFVSVSHDITREMQLEAELRQAQKMQGIGRLAAGIAHDFNNLLTSILGYSRFILDETDPRDRVHDDVEQIVMSAERAAKLTRQLLAFGRKQMVEVRNIDLNRVVTDMDKLLHRTLGEDIQLVEKKGQDLGQIRADTSAIEQIIMNLAVNARDAMPHGGSLIIRTDNAMLDQTYCEEHIELEPGPYVMLSVRDTGSGMSDDVLEHAFEPFFTTKDETKGTGLGLSTVYGIVKQFNGHLELHTKPGSGTEFRIYFPRTVERTLTPSLPTEKAMPKGSETILVVEDEDTVRGLAVRILRVLGYHVLQAHDGIEALQVAKEFPEPIDMLLTDVVMPNLGGPGLAERLVKTRADIRVLFMSGFTQDAMLTHGVIDHDTPLLLKPFTREGLAQKVRHILDETVKK